jgi:lysophospholipase L1-like esterase
MGTIGKIAFLFSLLLNLLILGLGSLWVYSKGGIPYILSKISLLQGWALRADSMYDTPYYWDKKSQFETLPKSEAEIVFLGDSLTDSCEWQEFFRNAIIKNRGISGDTTNGILNRIDEVVDSKPQKLFLMIGINDVNRGEKVDEILNNYKLILTNFRERIPQTQVFIQSILPINNQKRPNKGVNSIILELNANLKNLAKQFSFQYIDLFSAFLDDNNQLDARYTTDGVHLNGQGYFVWKRIIEKEVVQ